ncbi:predicted coding region AF_0150 [Archaeoglobus fulgidus DSM 4304]|uniref:Uncharacterized protein AF_0150 n=1 Tax=Archaeoglobus fulgidus (strain ATCC 49558 / DSM 4304 / JCM 9628 / NBRC 100126 / VC-16) TaxID=224325 RepID=Y150_ARCFU|nr:RecName: Full=Uncharacterized protein AF_0150 [Archaeoglobus fulgidus DSM 4304]AAB91087.1 predicted coding region AF_0150 [Archaeoglobus fulgidus DSM 4304]
MQWVVMPLFSSNIFITVSSSSSSRFSRSSSVPFLSEFASACFSGIFCFGKSCFPTFLSFSDRNGDDVGGCVCGHWRHADSVINSMRLLR